jgi:hypothetical protein
MTRMVPVAPCGSHRFAASRILGFPHESSCRHPRANGAGTRVTPAFPPCLPSSPGADGIAKDFSSGEWRTFDNGENRRTERIDVAAEGPLRDERSRPSDEQSI